MPRSGWGYVVACAIQRIPFVIARGTYFIQRDFFELFEDNIKVLVDEFYLD